MLKSIMLALLLLVDVYGWIHPDDPKYIWMEQQIEEDLEPYKHGISKAQLEAVENMWYRFVNFKIINNSVYGPDSKIKDLLCEICLRYTLPDVEFLYLMEDGFVQDDNGRNPPVEEGPVFGSSKLQEFSNVLYFADWNFSPGRSMPHCCSPIYDWPLAAQIVDIESQKITWEDKIECAVWRGGLQGYMYDYGPTGFINTPRGRACYLSLLRPDILNAGTSASLDNPYVKNMVDRGINPHKPFLAYKEQLQFKYIIDIDGHTSTYPGLQWKLLSNSTVLKQNSLNRMWYFAVLEPWVHYVPLKEDLSDLIEKVEWCIQHDDEARKIAEAGRKVAQENLLPDHCVLYCFKALRKYASLQTFIPQL